MIDCQQHDVGFSVTVKTRITSVPRPIDDDAWVPIPISGLLESDFEAAIPGGTAYELSSKITGLVNWSDDGNGVYTFDWVGGPSTTGDFRVVTVVVETGVDLIY